MKTDPATQSAHALETRDPMDTPEGSLNEDDKLLVWI